MDIVVHTHRVCLGECSLAQIPSLTHTALSALIYHDPMSPFFSITNAYDHISIVCDVETRHSLWPLGVDNVVTWTPGEWRVVEIVASHDSNIDWVDTVGVVNTATKPFQEAGISVYYLSSYAGDYVLVPESSLAHALSVAARIMHVHVEESLDSEQRHDLQSEIKPADELPPPPAPQSKLLPYSFMSEPVSIGACDRRHLKTLLGSVIEEMLFGLETKRFANITLVNEQASFVLRSSVLAALARQHAGTVVRSGEAYRVCRAGEEGSVLGFDDCGVVSQFAEPLGAAGVHLYYMSCYRTDYFLVLDGDVGTSEAILRERSVAQQHAEDDDDDEDEDEEEDD